MFSDSLTAHLDAVADDRLKDFDNLSWLRAQAPAVIAQWRPRVVWMRQLDRAAEAAQLGDGEAAQILSQIRRPEGALAHQYARAIHKYHQPDVCIRTSQDFERMVDEVGGSIFQLFPYLTTAARTAIRPLGALDQVMNILRDVHEDAQRGLCYFPQAELAVFGIQNWNPQTAGPLLRHWFEDRLPYFYRRARAFDAFCEVHPSLAALRESCWERYRRVELCYREVEFDATAFHERYWTQVRTRL